MAQTKKSRRARSASSPDYKPPDHSKRWRPRSRRGKVCHYTFDGKTCGRRGPHHCEPRADKVVAFFAEIIVHTKGRWARTAFILDPWQEHEIVRPLFGEVLWSTEWGCYVRRYTVAGIILGRKQGKSELAAAVALYLLIGDDEEAAEIYGAARDTKQAKKVWEPASRMRELQPLLDARLGVNKNEKRIFDEETSSYYEVITADALGELGANPHGFILDELLSQRDGSLWDSLRTAAGTRLQPLFLVISTETNDDASFAAGFIDELERVQADPSRAPHIFAYVRKMPRNDEELERTRHLFRGHQDLPVSCDPWDEANWRWACPALGSFLTYQALREEALEAKNEATKENAFRQYRLNQRVQQVTRWMPLHIWDASAGLVDETELEGRTCFGGLDMASTSDLAAWVLLFPPDEPAGDYRVLWRFFTPAAQLSFLDSHTGGKATVWARDGLLYVTEGDWIDYFGDPDSGRSHNDLDVPDPLAIHPKIADDHRRYRIVQVGYDQAQATATAQHMQSLGLEIDPVYQGFGLSEPLQTLMALTKAGRLHHGGHPVARWNADSVEVKTDDRERIKLAKPDRAASGKRIDGFAALANAIDVHTHYVAAEPAAATTIW